ncbi:MAG: Hcp family type VI secretion system effector [Paracoccaceae bacterium]
MAVDMFIKIKGVAGESEDNDHKGENDVLAWSWGMSQSGTMHVGGGGGAGKANFQDLGITKWVDKGSVTLMQACAKGSHIESANLIVRKAGDKPLEYIKLDMKELIVTSVSTGGSGGEDRLTENVSLNFREWKITYTPQDDKGGGAGAVDFGFNIAKNIAV